MPLETPDITPAQVISALTSLVAAAVVIFKLDMTDAQRGAIIGAISVIVTIVWQIADALIRRGRAQALAATTVVVPESTVARKKRARPKPKAKAE